MTSSRLAGDPLVMYYVVRKDVPLGFGRAMALAGAGAVRCEARFGPAGRWAPAFAAWRARPRKVALRAGAAELAAIAAAQDAAAVPDPEDPVLLCLPPRRRSDQGPALAELRPYTDGPRPRDPPEAAGEPALLYVVRAGLLRTAGKAMAQAGHAAGAAVRELGPRHPAAFAAWRAAGEPGVVRVAGDDATWARLTGSPDGVVVRDAGLTQVAPDTETVVAFAPGAAPPAADALPVLA